MIRMMYKAYMKTAGRILRGTLCMGALALSLAAAVSVTPLFSMQSYAAKDDDDEKDYSIDDAAWADDDGRAIAEWEKAESSTKYRVQLYRTSTKYPVGKEISTGSDSHDFSSAISQKGTGNYFFIVTPVKGGKDLAVTSDILEVDSDYMSELRAALKEKKESKSAASMEGGPRWVMNPTGTWKYLKADNTWAKNGWEQIDGKWYYFGSDNLMKTGWQKVRNYWYYLGDDGACWMNTTTPDGYTVNESGVWVDPETGKTITNYSGTAAAPVSTDINEVKLSLKESSAEAGSIRKAEVGSGSNVKVNEVNFSEPYENWAIGRNVTITVNVSAADNYKFTTTTKYSLGSATFQGSTGDEYNRVLTFSYSPKMTLETPDGLYITSDMVLKWNKVPNAVQYKVVLSYLNDEDTKSSKTLTVTKPEADLSEYAGMYSEVSVKVTAQGSKTSKSGSKTNSSLQDSAAATIEDLDAFIETNTMDGKFSSTGGSLSYKDESGSKLKGWQQLAGIWYYFDESGNAAGPGWFQDTEGGNLWYYFDSNHGMVTGKVTDNGVEYFLNDGSNPDLPVGAWVETQPQEAQETQEAQP
ncbi:MAG: hypothetical protein IJR62_01760 [Lachnospiraceae bacterium]|nr:hypothetical protein [Lachnospiraceae bacterium]